MSFRFQRPTFFLATLCLLGSLAAPVLADEWKAIVLTAPGGRFEQYALDLTADGNQQLGYPASAVR